MNERITIVSDVEISVQRNDSEFSRTRMKLTAGTLDIRQSIDVGSWDALGQAALIEALQCLRDSGSFAALRPKPTVRPFTPVEAAAHLGRRFGDESGNHGYTLVAVRHNRIESRTTDMTYEQLMTCTWRDTGEPCGVTTSAEAGA